MDTTAASLASESLDYIIVGGGTAGLVVAARLSEDPNVKVGVIEAGDYEPDLPEINIPGFFRRSLGNPKVDWSFFTTPQAHADARAVFQPRGKVLGGSSALNFMAMGRASAVEYDDFEALGNDGWNWSSFLKYFKKGEAVVPPSADISEKYHITLSPEHHGTDGPLHQSYPRHFYELQPLFVDAIVANGIPINPDPATGHNIGVSANETTVDARTATRSYSTTGYYEPNRFRSNLFVLTGAQATKIVFDDASLGSAIVATGVEYVSKGESYRAIAKREVILSAGSFQSPQLLELSGIGQKKYTSDLGVPQLIDLPGVGENLQDHVMVPHVFEIDPKYETVDSMDPTQHAHLLELYAQKKGLYTGVSPVLAFIAAHTVAGANAFEEIKRQHQKTAAEAPTPGLRKQFEFQLKWFDDPKQSMVECAHYSGMMFGGGESRPGARYQTLLNILLHPLSRGSVHIASPDPLEKPVIDPAYLSNAADLDVLVAAGKFAHKLASTPPLESAAVASMGADPDATDDEHLKAHIRKHVTTVFHPVGTASMLPKEDRGVVGPNLVVYGTQNVRVVDASIIPLQISAHTQGTVYALAEKAADIIKADYA